MRHFEVIGVCVSNILKMELEERGRQTGQTSITFHRSVLGQLQLKLHVNCKKMCQGRCTRSGPVANHLAEGPDALCFGGWCVTQRVKMQVLWSEGLQFKSQGQMCDVTTESSCLCEHINTRNGAGLISACMAIGVVSWWHTFPLWVGCGPWNDVVWYQLSVNIATWQPSPPHTHTHTGDGLF